LAFATGEPDERVRETISAWWVEMPETARAQVRERFQSTAEPTHLGAFWEIYLHACLLRLFGGVSVDIGEDQVARRRPDFALPETAAGVRVEATAAAGEDFVDRGERPRVNALYALLEQCRNRDYLFYLQLRAVGPNSLGRRFLLEIERWLDSLDLEGQLQRKARSEAPTRRTFDRDGWSISVDAIPRTYKEPSSGPGRGMIGSKTEGFEAGGMRAMDEAGRLRRSLRRKAAHHYELDERPFLLAVLCAGELVEDRDIAMALLGEIKYSVGGGGHYAGGGLWYSEGARPQNRDISGVLTVSELRPATAALVEPCLWTNPWARRPLPVAQFPWRRMEIGEDGRITEHPATRRAAEILTLAKRWPQES
jgi:hypothetical protein